MHGDVKQGQLIGQCSQIVTLGCDDDAARFDAKGLILVGQQGCSNGPGLRLKAAARVPRWTQAEQP